MKQYYPNQGLEILYNREETGDKALLNRNTFALSNFRLYPTGNMMRKESHHSIFKGGFTFLLGVIENLYNTRGYRIIIWLKISRQFHLDWDC